MSDILLHVSAPPETADEIVRQCPGGIQVVSTRDHVWKDSPRFGLAEGILIIGMVKGVAELGKVILEIVKLLKKSQQPNVCVRLELPNGAAATVTPESDPEEITQKITQRLT
jgi:hypothetical protein